MANKENSDIFISIHSNAHKRRNARGTETYVYPESYGDTLVLAKSIQNSLHGELNLIDRGVKFDRLYVLEETTMPSVLSEVAFITNRKEEELLVDPDFRQKAAIGLYKGIVAFFN
jgi:N-acetylmuramoyl-L-alanine amidase